MKVFLSHARKDASLALRLADRLERAGFDVWTEFGIVPGKNWARQVGKALDAAELMILLLTPSAMASDLLRQNFELAIGSRKYEGRLFTVLVGLPAKASKDVPWILLDLPHRRVESAKQFERVVKDIEALVAGSGLSPTNA